MGGHIQNILNKIQIRGRGDSLTVQLAAGAPVVVQRQPHIFCLMEDNLKYVKYFVEQGRGAV